MKKIMARQRAMLLSISIAFTIAVVGCSGSPAPAATPVATAPPTRLGPRFSGGGVIASGEIVPAQEADMSFTMSGRVRTVAVGRGDEVQPGQELVTLETSLLEADVRQAEAALAVAKAKLALVEVAPRPEEIAIAEAQLKSAEGALAQAMARRDQPDLGATEAEVSAAQAQVAGAMADRLLADQAHDQTMKCVNVQLDGEKRKICPALGPIEEQARYSLYATRAAQTAAQAQLDAILASGDAELRLAEAGVWTATAQRDVAEAERDTLQAGATPEEIAAAEAAVTQAQAEVQAARAALERATLRAPFAGTVAALDVSPGEAVTPGQVVLTLADVRHTRAETTDLSERDVDHVSVGQRATVFVEALNTEIAGRVMDIASQANSVGGDVVYPVTVELNDAPPGLRWGMSVEVEIAAE